MNCKKCFMTDARPGSVFEDGVCGACRNYERRKEIDWVKRDLALGEILSRFRSKSGYDMIIPVSGGKDSHRLVDEMVGRGMHPLLVTVNDSFTKTSAGVRNLANLLSFYNLNQWCYTISHDLFVRATRWAFEQTGEALKFVEYAIYTVPFMLAKALNIGLVMYGENAAYEYGTTDHDDYVANPQINSLLRKIEDEREWWNIGGINDDELDSIMTEPADYPLVLYMSYFIPWSSIDNYKMAKKVGFKDLDGEWDRVGTIENFEQIDSQAYMIHLWLKYPKFGFQRVSDIASRRVREGRLKLNEAQKAILEKDMMIDPIALNDFCCTLGYTKDEFWDIVHNAEWNKFYRSRQ